MAEAFGLRVGTTFEGHDQPGWGSHRALMKWGDLTTCTPWGSLCAATAGTRHQIPSWGALQGQNKDNINSAPPPVCTKTHRLEPVGQFSSSIPALGGCQLVPLPADPALLFLLRGQLCEQREETDQARGPGTSLQLEGKLKAPPKMRRGRWNCVLALCDRWRGRGGKGGGKPNSRLPIGTL